MLGECPPPLSHESAAFRFGGFGTHENVVYYDLVRHLVWECWERVVEPAADVARPAPSPRPTCSRGSVKPKTSGGTSRIGKTSVAGRPPRWSAASASGFPWRARAKRPWSTTIARCVRCSRKARSRCSGISTAAIWTTISRSPYTTARGRSGRRKSASERSSTASSKRSGNRGKPGRRMHCRGVKRPGLRSGRGATRIPTRATEARLSESSASVATLPSWDRT